MVRAFILDNISLDLSFHLNLVPRAHVPFGQFQDTELWNNQDFRTSGFTAHAYLGLPEFRVLVLTKRHVGSGNEIGD